MPAGSSTCETGSILPRVDYDNARALEIPDVARRHGQAVDKRRRGDQRVDLVAPVGNMQMRAAHRNLVINGQDASGELRPDMIVQPGAQARAPRGRPGRRDHVVRGAVMDAERLRDPAEEVDWRDVE